MKWLIYCLVNWERIRSFRCNLGRNMFICTDMKAVVAATYSWPRYVTTTFTPSSSTKRLGLRKHASQFTRSTGSPWCFICLHNKGKKKCFFINAKRALVLQFICPSLGMEILLSFSRKIIVNSMVLSLGNAK